MLIQPTTCFWKRTPTLDARTVYQLLNCIDADRSEKWLIFQHVSRSAIFQHFHVLHSWPAAQDGPPAGPDPAPYRAATPDARVPKRQRSHEQHYNCSGNSATCTKDENTNHLDRCQTFSSLIVEFAHSVKLKFKNL